MPGRGRQSHPPWPEFPLALGSALSVNWSEKVREAPMPFKDSEKRKAYKRIWAAAKRAKNPEPQREASRKYRAAHLELIRKKNRELMRARRGASKPPEI
jgi:hypothetical protein